MINLQEKHLIAIDLDGTLLNDDKNISPLNIKVLQALELSGNLVVLCTGRALRSAQYYHENIVGLKKSPIICYNGHLAANIHDTSFKEISYIIKGETVKKIYKDLIDKNLITGAMSENIDTIYCNEEDNFLFAFYDKTNMKLVKGPLNETIKDDVYTCVMHFNESIENVEDKINEVMKKYHDVSIRFWYGGTYCELYTTGVSKSRAIQDVANFYHIKKDNIIVFGDSDNDMEMLNDYKHSFLMRNGNPNLTKYAKNITTFNNNDDGVGKELIKLFNIRL